MKDYRNTKYCKEFYNIKQKKDELNKLILKEHPRVTNMYNKVNSNKQDSYKNNFMSIYNYKCSYCGCSIAIISKKEFEIDHFISTKPKNNSLNNLVLACYDCNRGKKDFLIPPKYEDKLNPDKEYIHDIFYRDNLYYIKINKEYKYDEIITTLFDKLDFNNISKRLDYLLLNLIGLEKQVKEKIHKNKECKNLKEIHRKLLEALEELRETRNFL